MSDHSEYGTMTKDYSKTVPQNKLLITNVVYGDVYSSIFLEQHLKSLLDESNIPAFKDRVEYLVFSDGETIPKLNEHPNFQRLNELIPVEIIELKWPEQPVDRFSYRYEVLLTAFKISVQKALEKKCYLSAIVADLVFARFFLQRVFSKLDAGFDSVFVQPPRCAAEVVTQELNKYPRAMPADDLWRLCYDNMHPLWVACHWDAAQFTKLPFSLLWNSGKGLLVRSFSITPIAFTPAPAMLEGRGMIDGDVPSMCPNPYWAHDWVDAPVVGVEPLFCYYPPFANHVATTKWLKEWSACLHPSQLSNLKEKLYYPSKEVAMFTADMIEESDKIIEGIL